MLTWEIALALGVVLLLLLLLVWWRARAPGGKAAAVKSDRIDTLTGWPPQATRLLSMQERLAFGTLSRALPEYMILSQVPVSRFVSVPKRNSYAEWLRRLGNQCVDFVVCDMAAQVIAVVEVQPQQPGERAHKRLTRIARTLKAAKIPLHRWTENALPTAEAIREAILQPVVAKAGAPGVAAAPPPPTTVGAPTAAVAERPLPSLSPFDNADRDSSHDEWIEVLEPPPTWYDDLDSDTVPLEKDSKP